MPAGDGRGAGTHPEPSLSSCWSTDRAGDRIPRQNLLLGTLKRATPRCEAAGRFMALAAVAGNRHPPMPVAGRCMWLMLLVPFA